LPLEVRCKVCGELLFAAYTPEEFGKFDPYSLKRCPKCKRRLGPVEPSNIKITAFPTNKRFEKNKNKEKRKKGRISTYIYRKPIVIKKVCQICGKSFMHGEKIVSVRAATGRRFFHSKCYEDLWWGIAKGIYVRPLKNKWDVTWQQNGL